MKDRALDLANRATPSTTFQELGTPSVAAVESETINVPSGAEPQLPPQTAGVAAQRLSREERERAVKDVLANTEFVSEANADAVRDVSYTLADYPKASFEGCLLRPLQTLAPDAQRLIVREVVDQYLRDGATPEELRACDQNDIAEGMISSKWKVALFEEDHPHSIAHRRVPDPTRARLQSAGIVLADPIDESSIGPLDPDARAGTAYNYVWMTPSSVNDLAATAQHLEVQDLAILIEGYGGNQNIAETLHRLMALVQLREEQGQIDPAKRPYTQDCPKELAVALTHLRKNLRKCGIQDTRVGIEAELGTSSGPINGSEAWTKEREAFIADVANGRTPHAPERANEITEAAPREVLAYKLMYRTPELAGLCSPLFGPTRDGDGVYDGKNCLELKLHHCPVEESPARYQAVRHAVAHAGLDFEMLASVGGTHTNLSFVVDGRNIFDPNHPRYDELAPKILAGVTRAFYEARAFVADPFKPLVSVDASLSRGSLLRISFGGDANRDTSQSRFEVRPDGVDDPALMAAIAMAGVRSALSPKSRIELPTPQRVLGLKIAHARDQFKVLSHLLGNSTVDVQSGRLQIPEDYLKEKALTIARELKLLPDSDVILSGLEDSFFKAEAARRFAAGLRALLESVTVQIDEASGNISLHWPESSTFTFGIPMPEQIANLDDNEAHRWPGPGMTTGADIKRKYLDGTLTEHELVTWVPPPEGRFLPEQFTIDVDALRDSIHAVAGRPAWIVPTNFTEVREHERSTVEELLQSRLESLRQSPILREQWPPAFRKKMIDLFEARTREGWG